MVKGFSLHPSDKYLAFFAQQGDPIEYLLGLGVESLEFVVRDPCLSEELALVKRCQDAGYQVTLHPVWAGVFEVTEFADEPANEIRQNFEELFKTAGTLANRQEGPVIIVVHGPTYPTEAPEYYTLGINTMATFLHWAGNHAQRAGHRLLFGFENRPKIAGNAKMGESHANTLKIVEQADHELVAITWDMGHSGVNAHQGSDDLYPPQAFLERVIHVHIHDLKDGTDHYPLLYDGLPYAEYIARLAKVGYRGVLNLEVPDPARLGLAGSGVLADISESLVNIDRALISCCVPPASHSGEIAMS